MDARCRVAPHGGKQCRALGAIQVGGAGGGDLWRRGGEIRPEWRSEGLTAGFSRRSSFATVHGVSTVRELRIALTVDDYERAVAFYRDALGLREVESWVRPDGRGTILDAGRATLELFDAQQAETLDAIEVGRRTSGPVRLALHVGDSVAVAAHLVNAAPAWSTRWSSRHGVIETRASALRTACSSRSSASPKTDSTGRRSLSSGDDRSCSRSSRRAGLAKRFKDIEAVAGVDLQVPAGGVYGFLGPNGAGKTTTIRMLLGLIRPTRGSALLFGEAIHPGAPVIDRVGAMVERPAFYPYLSAIDNLRLLGLARGLAEETLRTAVPEAIDRVGLTEAAKRKAGRYSTGMRQRLGIAAALLGRPELVILDEPANGLDPNGVVEVRQLIQSLARDGITVFLSSHVLPEVEQLCQRVAVLQRGKVIARATRRPCSGRASACTSASIPPRRRAARRPC
jgi:ABC-2 type transport system ATP-binding protein